MDQGPPHELPSVKPTPQPPREEQILLAKKLDGRHSGPRACEGVEERADRLLHLLIRIQDDSVLGVIQEADRQGRLEFTATGLIQDAAA